MPRLQDMSMVKRRTPLGDSPADQTIAHFSQQVTGGTGVTESA
ncbi:hypothetical protein [Haloactinomyces albus]|uniref:Uncharacterized protein n=1 Tax=Haloactinomyces albus TaxID=1352928 RepID=A0AAE3ZIG7_9ACTN|nr:hypothetical protein [Haloactinomyces albus]MDR7304204.1 hypothetical protein [Haloactinomyces albus]